MGGNIKRTLAYHAVEQKNSQAVKLLREHGADFGMISKSGRNLLHVLADVKWYDGPSDNLQVAALFDMLVSEGCDVNRRDDEGRTPLHWAIESGNIPVIKKLIECEVDVNFTLTRVGWTPLHLAILKNDVVEVIELLLDSGARVNGHRVRPLHLAINFQSDTRALEILLDRGAEVNAADLYGATVLAKTLFFNYAASARVLLEYGADVNADCVARLLPRCWKSEAGRLLLEHWAKLVSLGLACRHEYLEFARDSVCVFWYLGCVRELDQLRTTFVDRGRTSLYDWLRMSANRRYAHSRHLQLRGIVNSTTLKHQFPNYSTLILGSYRQAVTRQFLLETAKNAWMALTRIYLPDVCLELVFSYLDNTELADIVQLDEGDHRTPLKPRTIEPRPSKILSFVQFLARFLFDSFSKLF